MSGVDTERCIRTVSDERDTYIQRAGSRSAVGRVFFFVSDDDDTIVACRLKHTIDTIHDTINATNTGQLPSDKVRICDEAELDGNLASLPTRSYENSRRNSAHIEFVAINFTFSCCADFNQGHALS